MSSNYGSGNISNCNQNFNNNTPAYNNINFDNNKINNYHQAPNGNHYNNNSNRKEQNNFKNYKEPLHILSLGNAKINKNQEISYPIYNNYITSTRNTKINKNPEPSNPIYNNNIIPTGNTKINKNPEISNPINNNNITPTGNTKINKNPGPSNPINNINVKDMTSTGNNTNNIQNERNSNYYNNLNLTPRNENEIIHNNNENIYNNAPQNNQNNNQNLNLPFSFKQYKMASLVKLDDVKVSMTFLSSVIRCLSNIKSIIKYYLDHLNDFKSHAQDMPLSYHFCRMIYNLYPFPQNSSKTSFSLQTFYKALIHSNPSFKGNSLKNPIDFIIFLLGALHNEDRQMLYHNNLNDNFQKNQEDLYEFVEYLKNYEKSIIFNIFGWINQTINICEECKEETTMFTDFSTFDLNIENTLNILGFEQKKTIPTITIYDCIKNQSKEEKLYNKYCRNCRKKNLKIKKSIFRVRPNYFIFLLKLNNKQNIEKLKNVGYKIKIEKVVDFDMIIKDSDINRRYELVGMVVYNNLNNMEEYIAYCFHPIDQKWYKYDINNICKIDIDELLKQEDLLPVILFYKAKN